LDRSEQRWRDQSYNEEVFPEVAAAALGEMTPCKHVSPWDVIRWLHQTTQLPEQRDVEGRFGNPPITLYDGSRFYIDVYYWLDGTTSIHQHAFCGAFQVLTGSSILSQYGFDESRRINAHFLAGKMNLNKVELLEQGDIRQIFPGRQYIHSLFHLDRPSVSIIVIGDLLSCSDFHTAFSVLDIAFNTLPNDPLERAFGLSTGKQRFEALFEIVRRRHGELADLILPVLEEVRRQQNLIQRRGQITSNEHRFFLALLLNVPDRAKIVELVRQRFPEQDPVDTITEWVDELANTKVAGSSEPNVLGIHNYGEDYLFVFQCLLEGLTPEGIKAAFEEEFSVKDAPDLGSKPEELCDAIRNSILFQSIFVDSRSALTASQSIV